MPIRELTPAEEARLMTQGEVDMLPTGSIVLVKWGGGNGPHPYVIVQRAGEAYAGFILPNDSKIHIRDRLEPVGKLPCHHRVFLFK